MSQPDLVTDIATQSLFGSETFGQRNSIGERTSAIVANVEYQAIGIANQGQDIVEVSGSDCAVERTVAHVGHRVATIHHILHPRRVPVVRAQIILPNQIVVEVGGIILVPRPVARNVERCIDIDVAIAQRIDHLVEHVK